MALRKKTAPLPDRLNQPFPTWLPAWLGGPLIPSLFHVCVNAQTEREGISTSPLSFCTLQKGKGCFIVDHSSVFLPSPALFHMQVNLQNEREDGLTPSLCFCTLEKGVRVLVEAKAASPSLLHHAEGKTFLCSRSAQDARGEAFSPCPTDSLTFQTSKAAEEGPSDVACLPVFCLARFWNVAGSWIS